MKLGLVTYNLARSWDLETVISRCEAAGYEAVQLRTEHRHGVEVTLNAAERTEVRDRFRDSGIEEISLGSTCEYHSLDAAEVGRQIELTKRFVDLAVDIGPLASRCAPMVCRKPPASPRKRPWSRSASPSASAANTPKAPRLHLAGGPRPRHQPSPQHPPNHGGGGPIPRRRLLELKPHRRNRRLGQGVLRAVAAMDDVRPHFRPGRSELPLERALRPPEGVGLRRVLPGRVPPRERRAGDVLEVLRGSLARALPAGRLTTKARDAVATLPDAVEHLERKSAGSGQTGIRKTT